MSEAPPEFRPSTGHGPSSRRPWILVGALAIAVTSTVIFTRAADPTEPLPTPPAGTDPRPPPTAASEMMHRAPAWPTRSGDPLDAAARDVEAAAAANARAQVSIERARAAGASEEMVEALRATLAQSRNPPPQPSARGEPPSQPAPHSSDAPPLPAGRPL